MTYQNRATGPTPALVVFLLDVSGSMGKPMPGAVSRIQVVKDALRATIKEMVQRSLKAGMISPRYRVAMVAYSDDVYDILDGIKTIDYIAQKDMIPNLQPLNRTRPDKGFRYTKKLLLDDIARWNQSHLRDCPAPLVIHMTDAEFSEKIPDPEPIVREIEEIMVPDGNVLVENIYIADDIQVPTQDIFQFKGFRGGDDLGNPLASRLLEISSPMPEMYRTEMNDLGFHIQPGTAMMFPGVRKEFVQMAFVMGAMSSTTGDRAPQKKWEDD